MCSSVPSDCLVAWMERGMRGACRLLCRPSLVVDSFRAKKTRQSRPGCSCPYRYVSGGIFVWMTIVDYGTRGRRHPCHCSLDLLPGAATRIYVHINFPIVSLLHRTCAICSRVAHRDSSLPLLTHFALHFPMLAAATANA
ncbi:hypothetical protein EJ04DRAFT_220838 [Polyplosphaeria fusca]|uniref:Uncharacterized protein n=1 Tax=Polyplosphaeria fusca TaxID=682080 RepID=A0A9P4R1L7_9PLEO|nr:hypothetical protein EJ04DRAFT_220838 [Polyplosphaeria fusca]